MSIVLAHVDDRTTNIPFSVDSTSRMRATMNTVGVKSKKIMIYVVAPILIFITKFALHE